MTLRRWIISNQRWKNVVYVHVEIYNVEQRQINVIYFNVDINNVRQRRNNVVILNVEFHNVDQRRNNVLYMTIFKKLKRAKKYFWASKKRWLIWLTTLAFDCDRLKRKGSMERTILGDNRKYMPPILVPSSAKRIATQIIVIAKLNGRKDFILRAFVCDVIRPSKELPLQS